MISRRGTGAPPLAKAVAPTVAISDLANAQRACRIAANSMNSLCREKQKRLKRNVQHV